MLDVDRSQSICVIGAGSSGLAAAKNLKEQGFDVDVLERERDLGGNWNYELDCARVYRSTHTITSKHTMRFVDFSMPGDFPEYPHHSQICNYLQQYADRFRLRPLIEFNNGVERIEPEPGTDAWNVTLSNGQVRRYAAVVIANGHNWSPRYPDYPGELTADVFHSADYKTAGVFEGKTVLVVGGGNSGCDIAVESAQHGCRTFHSNRRGYYYIPKFLLGTGSERLGQRMRRIHLPLFLRRWLMQTVLRFSIGTPERNGLPTPDHRLYETHPLVNTLLPYYVRHGDIAPKPDIDHFAGRRVHFVDGTSEEVDVVVYATGYNIVFPFIENKWLNWQEGKPRLYKNVFHPTSDTLFVAGLIQPDSGQFGLVDWQMRAVAAWLRARKENPLQLDWFRNQRQQVDEDLTNGVKMQSTARHSIQVDAWSYRRALQKLITQLESIGVQSRAA